MDEKELNFYQENIKNKNQYIQKEHKQVLDIIYKNACDTHCVNGYDLDKNICQAMNFTKIQEKANNAGLSTNVLYVCIQDLESLGLIMNVHNVATAEYKYAILKLGLVYLKNLDN